MHTGGKPSATIQRKQRPGRARIAGIPESLSTRTLLWLAFGFVSLVLAVYWRSLDFQFILDDHRFTADPRIQESGHVWDYFANYVWAQVTGAAPSFYRPLFILWMRINFLLAGLSPWGWHLLSIAKHVVVAALLGMLVWKLLHDWPAALAAATLFALHPAQTESVSWVTVPDPLMAAGILAALLFYLKYVNFGSSELQTQGKKPRKKSVADTHERSSGWMFASAAAYFAALLSKETAIVFPVVIFALALCVARGQTPVKGGAKPGSAAPSIRLVQALRHTLPFVCVTVLYLLLRIHALGGRLGSATQHLPWRTVILSWPATLWFYVKVILWPAKSYSFADPNLVEKSSVHGVLLPLAGLACCASILVMALFWVRRKAQAIGDPRGAGLQGAVVAGTLLLVLPLLPALNLNALNPGDFLHGRYTYLPLAGLLLLLATVWSLLNNARVVLQCAGGALVVVIVIAFGALTFSQEKEWKDDATVFATAHQLAPHNGPVA
jgi:protein O-mannosyl-transferase